MNTTRLLADVPLLWWCLWLSAMNTGTSPGSIISLWRIALAAPTSHASRHHLTRSGHTHPRRALHAARTVYANPCGGRRSSHEDDTLTDTSGSAAAVAAATTPLHQHLELIRRDAALAKDQVTALMNKYLTERFQHTINHNDFNDFRLKGLPRIPKVTYQDFHEQIDIQVHTSLNGTYDRLVTMDMFLNDIRIDERLYHGELGFARYIEVISNSHITNLLCRLRIAMVDLGVHYDNNHVKKALRHEVRDVTSTALRYISDYIILRELENALKYMEVEFSVLKIRAQTSDDGTL